MIKNFNNNSIHFNLKPNVTHSAQLSWVEFNVECSVFSVQCSVFTQSVLSECLLIKIYVIDYSKKSLP